MVPLIQSGWQISCNPQAELKSIHVFYSINLANLFSCYFFYFSTVIFFPVTFFPVTFFSYFPTVTFFPVTFFPVTFFPVTFFPLLFFLLLSFLQSNSFPYQNYLLHYSDICNFYSHDKCRWDFVRLWKGIEKELIKRNWNWNWNW